VAGAAARLAGRDHLYAQGGPLAAETLLLMSVESK
jgi:hypothetical protein